MLMSKLLGDRYKEKPADAFLESHIFLLRGGYIRQVTNGIFSMLTPAKKTAQKIESIIREEMDNIDGQEVMFPVVLPAELWQESGRFESVGSELIRFKDRTNHDMVLGMTHEEAAVQLARSEAKSYLKYPFMIYQIQTKFRDEPRARGGLIRVREFTMKDGYSFHTSQEDLAAYYDKVLEAYKRIYKRVGLKNVIAIQSDTGMMGGQTAHEFMYLSEGGEDTIVLCDHCGYQSNMDVAVSKIQNDIVEEDQIQEVHTPNIKDIEGLARFLSVKQSQIMKATVFLREDNHMPVIVFIRGDLQVNEVKLKKVIKTNVTPLTEHENIDLCFGFIGAYKLDANGAQVIFDTSLLGEVSLACGANKVDYHLKGINIKRDLGISEFVDIAKVNENDSCILCGKSLRICKGIEVGNIFQLGTKYTKSMDMTFVNENGNSQTPLMGCYGIGVGRLLACVIEENHDAYGPIWPASIAPWKIHICMLNNTIEEIKKIGMEIYSKLQKNYDTIIDDRNVAAGVQFADADLLGAPIRIIISKRNIINCEVEIVTRDKSLKQTVKIESIYNFLKEYLC